MHYAELVISYLTYSLCIIAFIIGIVSIYFIQCIWAYREHAFVKPRSPVLTYSILWIYLFVLLLAIINALLYLLIGNIWETKYYITLNDFIHHATTLSYAIRAWILFYFVEYSYESVNHIWRTQMTSMHLSPNDLPSTSMSMYCSDASAAAVSVNLSSDSISRQDTKLFQKSLFYIKYHDTLGNPFKIFPIIIGLILPLLIINDDPDDTIYWIILRSLYVLIYIFIVSITYYWVYCIHLISDKYYIGKELSRINASLSLFIIISKITNIMFYINHVTATDIYIYAFINNFCTIFSIIFSLYFSSFWILRKLLSEFAGNDTLKQVERNHKYIKLQTIVTFGLRFHSQFEKQKSQINNNSNPFPLKLNDVLGSKLGFEIFTQFLISELSVENILFLVEVKQYKACCRKYNQSLTPPASDAAAASAASGTQILPNGKTINNEEFPKISQFGSLKPSTTTRSKPDLFKSKTIGSVSYVPSNSQLQNLDPYDYAQYLYKKYIQTGSNLQVNISGTTRNKLVKYLIDCNKTDIVLNDDYVNNMFKLYDNSWEEIFQLTKGDSFARFILTKEYQELCHKQVQISSHISDQSIATNKSSNKSNFSVTDSNTASNNFKLNWNSNDFKETIIQNSIDDRIEEEENDKYNNKKNIDNMLNALNTINKYDKS